MNIRRNLYFILFVFAISFAGTFVSAENANELRQDISKKQGDIEKLEAEIKKYEKDLNVTSRKKRTLQGSVYELDTARKHASASISLAERKIKKTKNKIYTLSEKISQKEVDISSNKSALAQALRRTNEAEDDTFIEHILKNNNLSEVWREVESLHQFQGVVRGKVSVLSEKRDELELLQTQAEKETEILGSEKKTLTSQKRSLDISRREKARLLSITKNKESNYQAILREKKKAKEQFEREMREIESRLRYVLDKSSIPAVGSGVLSWPLKKVHITQYFGNTRFAKSGAYNGRGHNGTDFRAAIGTRVSSSADGTVMDVNHGVARNCQYGKWVLVKHNNGLTTLYAHLSEVSVSKGAKVSSGQLVGYSGNTGYSTGPHLHMSVYASGAVKFKQYKCRSGPTVKVPVAAYSGYLNPLDYL